MGYGKTDSKSTDEHDRQGALDLSLIPEDKPTERLNWRMKKIFDEARKKEAAEDDNKDFWIPDTLYFMPFGLGASGAVGYNTY